MKVKAKVHDMEGKEVQEVELPEVFSESVRIELISRAVVASRANRLQPYGPGARSGLNYAVDSWGVGRGVSRVPRLTTGQRARVAPQTVGGRRAHPPKPERIWAEKINRKERRMAIRSAIAATANPKFVQGRGHRYQGILPLVVTDDIQEIKKTSDVVKLLRALKMEDEMSRISRRKIRAGKGTRRGRKYKESVGPLIVVGEDRGISLAGRNIPGVEVTVASRLCTEDLAPGTHPGRLVIWSSTAIKMLGEVWK
jgi:large subunit ribosomal protein L4e